MMMRVVAVRCRYPQSAHHFFDADIAIAPREIWDVYGDQRLRLRKALARVWVVKYEPKVRLEKVDAAGVLRMIRGRRSAGGRRE
jgi:hypothetical protein